MSNKSLAKIILLAALTFGFASVAPEARGQQPAAGSVELWNDQGKNGQWRGFGNGLQDTAPLPDGHGLKLIVNWTQATWGIGAIYQSAPDNAGDSPFPKISKFRKIRLEIRSDVDDQTSFLMELACTEQEKDFRPADSFAKPVTKEWQTVEIELSREFPNLDQARYPLDAIRLLFLNSSKTGTNTLEFRNLVLVP